MSKCTVCGRPLTSPASVAAGIGPICGQRGYEYRIGNRHAAMDGGWNDIEAWQRFNKPCYSCKFFRFPTKGNETTCGDCRIVRHGELEQEFPLDAIGGYCSIFGRLVDGNVIGQDRECWGEHYVERQYSRRRAGLLRIGEQDLLFML